jgi:hypothetical protein
MVPEAFSRKTFLILVLTGNTFPVSRKLELNLSSHVMVLLPETNVSLEVAVWGSCIQFIFLATLHQ